MNIKFGEGKSDWEVWDFGWMDLLSGGKVNGDVVMESYDDKEVFGRVNVKGEE